MSPQIGNNVQAPKSVQELLQRADDIAGLSIGELAKPFNFSPPKDFKQNKGWVGQLLELVLGASAKSKSEPDFQEIGIELKTIPLNNKHQPQESTFVCTVPKQLALTWHHSRVWKKLKHVLWVPIAADKNIPIVDRRIGRAILWSPTGKQEETLKQDWNELTEMLSLGRYEELTAKRGTYLQCRPKAAHSKILRKDINASGEQNWIVPRGFYLRTHFTKEILAG